MAHLSNPRAALRPLSPLLPYAKEAQHRQHERDDAPVGKFRERGGSPEGKTQETGREEGQERYQGEGHGKSPAHQEQQRQEDAHGPAFRRPLFVQRGTADVDEAGLCPDQHHQDQAKIIVAILTAALLPTLRNNLRHQDQVCAASWAPPIAGRGSPTSENSVKTKFAKLLFHALG
jgi:hypothetical protein